MTIFQYIRLPLLCWIFLSACQTEIEQQSSSGLCDEKLRQGLATYLSQPPHQRDQEFTEEILTALSQNDSTIIERLEKEIQAIKEGHQMDSLWRLFTEEPDFKPDRTNNEIKRYRLTTFKHLEELLEIYRVEQTGATATLVYKKIRLVCDPPIISGKELEKSCFQVLGSSEQLINTQEIAELENQLSKTRFWEMSGLRYHSACFDGESWDFEALQNGRYRRIDRNCPNYYDVVYLIGKQMIAMVK